jgi:hypothetical protein
MVDITNSQITVVNSPELSSLLTSAPVAPTEQTGTLKDAKTTTDDKSKTGNKTDSKKEDKDDKGADKRSRHYIRIKFGGDPTGTLPTTASSEPDKSTFEYMAQALKMLGGDATLISATELAAKWEQERNATNNELAARLQALGGDATLISAAQTVNKINTTPKTQATDKPSSPNPAAPNQPIAKDKNIVIPDYLKPENFKPPSTTPATNTATPTLRKFDTNDASTGTKVAENIKSGQLGVGKFDIKTEDLVKAGEQAKVKKQEAEGTREIEFNSLNGDLLGRTEVISSSTQHNSAKFTIYDPKDEFRAIIPKLKNVQVTIGFVDGYSKNVFVGIVLEVGRKPPHGTFVWAIDPSYELKAPASGTNVTSPPNTSSAQSDAKTMAELAGTLTLLGGDKRLINLAETLNKDLQSQEQVKSIAQDISAIDSNSELAKIAGSLVKKPTTPQTPTTPQAPATTPQTPTTPQAPATTPQQASATQNPAPSTNGDLLAEIKKADNSMSPSLAQQFVGLAPNKDLKFKDQTNGITIQKMGEVQLQQSQLAAAQTQAALKGDIVVVRGNTLVEASPGKGESTGVILDFKGNPSTFIGAPVIKKRSPVSLQGPAGGVMVQGWNPQTKQLTRGIAYTQGGPTQHPTGVINPPEWKAVKLSDPIIPGSPYTWGDATKEGARVPETKQIMGGIIRIATIITEFTKKTGQQKWVITSWYRDPVSNRNADGATNSRHLYGDAVDFYFDGPEYTKFFKELWADGEGGKQGWAGGIAQGSGFTHIDDRASQGEARSRWYY